MPLVLFAVLFVLLLVGFPVAFTLAGVSVVFGLLESGSLFVFKLLPSRIWGVMTNVVLIAVPLFIYMGVMLEKSGIAEELLETMALLFGKLRGGLAISVVAVGALLAASTGIVGATVVTMGLLSLPTMLKRGYSPELASGTICASGTLGQIVPPSIVLVLLGSILNVDIGGMFLGAVVPGVLLIGLYLGWIVLLSIVRPEAAPPMPAEEVEAFRADLLPRLGKAFLPPLALIIAVLGSIFAGIASPTEAAAVGAAGATLLTLLKKRLNLEMLQEVMGVTTRITCMVFIILVGARAFGLVFVKMGGNAWLTELIEQSNLGPQGFLLLVMVVVFIAGFFIDFIEITFIIVPVVAPLLQAMGVDLLWFGILIALNLQTSFLTPPFGFSLFYLRGVADGVTTAQLYRGIVPYIVIQLITLLLVALVPDAALWLPRVFSP